MSILNNAIASIQIGMEDFNSDDPRRVLSAIRNIYAGILLLFKHKLFEMSPPNSDEALLKTRILPVLSDTTGQIIWTGQGPKTVDVRDIRDRLTALGIEGIDWKRINNLQKIRNNIEHYYTELTNDKMREAISDALHLILQFCEPHLGVSPQDLFGTACWSLMLSVSAIYETELKSCRDNLSSAEWPYEVVTDSIPQMVCPACDSNLIRIADLDASIESRTFICSACNTESIYSEVVAPAVESTTEIENYWAIKDGGDPYTSECPVCERGTYVNIEGACVACFEQPIATQCVICHASLTVDEGFHGNECSDCQYRIAKMMKE